MLPHVKIDVDDEAVPFEHRNEHARREQALRRMQPAHQRLRTIGLFGTEAVFRLQIDLELLAVHGLLHFVDNFLLLQDLSAHLRHIIRQKCHVAALAFLGREGRALVHALDALLRVLDHVHAEGGFDEIVPIIGGERLVDFIHLRGDPRLVEALAQAECIGADAGIGAGLDLVSDAAQQICRVAQEPVPLLLAPKRVEQVEVIDVKTKERKFAVCVTLQQQLRLREKLCAVKEVGQRVMLIGVLHLAEQIELAADDDVLQSQQQDACLVGFGYEIPGTEVEHFLLGIGVAFARHGDDRQRCVGSPLDALKEGISVHDRHHQIQQYGRNALASVQDVKRFFPVARFQDLIFCAQNLTQDLPIHFLIFYDQNRRFSVTVHLTRKPLFICHADGHFSCCVPCRFTVRFSDFPK